MEQKNVEGLLFHKTCFRCTACNCKLECKFGKSELGFFCLTHFHQIAKVTGGYKTGTGPTRNAEAASYVDAMVNRGVKKLVVEADDVAAEVFPVADQADCATTHQANSTEMLRDVKVAATIETTQIAER